MLTHDLRAQEAVRRGGRWFPRYLLALGAVAAAWIVVLEAVFDSGLGRVLAAAGGALALLGLSTWAEGHDVQPRGSRRTVVAATAAWFGLYLVAVGPVVRWRTGTSLGWWAVAGVLTALPFLLAAVRARRAS